MNRLVLKHKEIDAKDIDTFLQKIQLLALQSTQEGNSDIPLLSGSNEAFFHPIW